MARLEGLFAALTLRAVATLRCLASLGSNPIGRSHPPLLRKSKTETTELGNKFAYL